MRRRRGNGKEEGEEGPATGPLAFSKLCHTHFFGGYFLNCLWKLRS
jgi:hypothetical protein